MPHIRLSRFGHSQPVFYTVEVRRNGSWTRYVCHAPGVFTNPSPDAYAAEWLHQQARRDGYTAIRCLAQQGSVVEERWLDDDELFDGTPDPLPDDLAEGVFVPRSWRRKRSA